MMTRTSWIILGLAIAAATLGGWLQYQSRQLRTPAGVAMAQVGDQAPDLSLRTLDGRPQRLSQFRGRPLLVNFWATWCPPCLAEMPRLSAASARGGSRTLILGVAMDDADHVRSYLGHHPVHYQVVLGQLDSRSSVLQLGDQGGVLPYSVLISADGRILRQQRGVLNAATLAAWLATER